jgi:heptaprenyl diphosphate synthase
MKWANAFAVMTGDFLLAKAYAVAAELGSGICRLLAQVSAGICAAEAAVCDGPQSVTPSSPDDYLDGLASRGPALHAFACNVACELAAVPPALVATLTSLGASLGMASYLAAEAREFDHLDEHAFTLAISSRLSRGAWSLPLLLAVGALGVNVSEARSSSGASPELSRAIADILRTGPVIQNTLDQASRFVRHAKAHVLALPQNELRGEMLAAADDLVPAVIASPPQPATRTAGLPTVDLREPLLASHGS